MHDPSPTTINAPATGARPDAVEVPQFTIPEHRIVRLIGTGGMGEVWEGEQLEPIRRRVAIKVIRWGMDSRDVVARFVSERQATAMMSHPGIARVFDAGTTSGGRPYFTMEFVEGRPITSYCDARGASIRERLRLFTLVCEAVQHAHQKGIIHRDIKPSNVLVGLQDGEPVPKIIDFGIAKATAQPLTEQTVFTEYGQLIGTPAYMSPEQADLTSLDIDTRTDIYALGILLYELLVGSLPFDSTELRQAGFDVILRRIREEEPPRPSTRVSRLGEAAGAAASHRGTDARSLIRHLRGDLDWIVMKAVEKDRARRYATANALALDVHRHLHDEPIQARPPSAKYRLAKFTRRHKAGVAAASLLLVALLLGVAGTTMGFLRARQAEARAEENFRLARGAVDDFLTRVSESRDLRASGLEPLRRQLLGTAREFYERFLRQRTDDATLLAELGGAHIRLGRIDRAMGQNAEAEKSFEQARVIFDRLAGESSDPRIVAEQVRALGGLGLLYADTSRFEAAEAIYTQAAALDAKLVSADPALRAGIADVLDDRGSLYNRIGRGSESERSHKEALAIRERLVQTAPTEANEAALVRSYVNLASVLATSGRPEAGDPYLQKAVTLGEKLVSDHPEIAEHENQLAAVLNNLGGVYTLTGRPQEAEAAHRRGLALRERVARRHPTVVDYGLRVAGSRTNLGEIAVRDGRPAAGLPELQAAIDLLKGVLEREPRQATARYYLSYTYGWQARAYQALGRARDALGSWDQAIALDDRAEADLQAGRAGTLVQLGRLVDARAAADTAAKVSSASSVVLYDLAAVYSVLSRENRASAARAVETLQRAADAGYFKVRERISELQRDPRFAPLRSQPGYAALVDQLQGGK